MVNIRFHDRTLKEFAYTTIKCLDRQVKGCLELSLGCRDVPVATSPLLKSLGFSDYKVKKFWKIAKSFTGFSINIYRYEETCFYIVLEVRREPLLAYQNVYVDFIDCQQVHCTEYPKGNKLYIYIEGSLEGNFMKINGVFLLKKLLELRPGCYKEVMSLIYGSLRGDLSLMLKGARCLFNLVNAYKDLVSIVLPKTPVCIRDLVMVSPIIRVLFSSKLKLLPST